MSNEERTALHAQLDKLLDQAPDLSSIQGTDDASCARRRSEASLYCGQVLDFARRVARPGLIACTTETAVGGNLSNAGQMLGLALRFFGTVAGAPSISEIAFDLKSIDAGSLPKFIVPSKRAKKTPAYVYAIRHHQLAALCWDARLQVLGYSAEDSHELVRKSYGKSWSAISDWPSMVRATLGNFQVDTALHFARVNAATLVATSDYEVADLFSALQAAGQSYIAEEQIAATRGRK